MKTNVKAYQGNTTVMKAVNAGEIPGGVIYHYYWFGDQAKTGENSQNVKLHYFKNEDPGAFVSISGGGVLRSSKNAAAAQAFLNFITGIDGQTILQTGTSFEYPVASDVAANPKLVPLKELDAPTIDPSTLDSTLTTDLMTAGRPPLSGPSACTAPCAGDHLQGRRAGRALRGRAFRPSSSSPRSPILVAAALPLLYVIGWSP